MQVQYRTNYLNKLTPNCLKRIFGWVSDGDHTLKAGAHYVVQALEEQDNILLYYIHGIEEAYYPLPYPAELFKITDPSLSKNWVVSLKETTAGLHIKRITFPEWANDDIFFERLLDAWPKVIEIYKKNRER